MDPPPPAIVAERFGGELPYPPTCTSGTDIAYAGGLAYPPTGGYAVSGTEIAMSGTAIVYAAICLRACDAMSGTEIANNGAAGADRRHGTAIALSPMLLCPKALCSYAPKPYDPKPQSPMILCPKALCSYAPKPYAPMPQSPMLLCSKQSKQFHNHTQIIWVHRHSQYNLHQERVFLRNVHGQFWYFDRAYPCVLAGSTER
eukprot:466981-Rhodomonas_salina.6